MERGRGSQPQRADERRRRGGGGEPSSPSSSSSPQTPPTTAETPALFFFENRSSDGAAVVVDDFDDGHCPENLLIGRVAAAGGGGDDDAEETKNGRRCRLAYYPEYFDGRTPQVRVFRDSGGGGTRRMRREEEEEAVADRDGQPPASSPSPPEPWLRPELCDALYEWTAFRRLGGNNGKEEEGTTATKEEYPSERQRPGPPPPPWGTYVTLESIVRNIERRGRQCRREPQDCTPSSATTATTYSETAKSSSSTTTTTEDVLALEVATSFLWNAICAEPTEVFFGDGGGSSDCRNNNDSSETSPPLPTPLWTWDDMKLSNDDKDTSKNKKKKKNRVHGVAVWGLPAYAGAEVPYHIDYAEQVRYETNVVVPPVLAGTLQCTPGRVRGGEYCVCFGDDDVGSGDGDGENDGAGLCAGLKHYLRHGYKGCRRPPPSTNDGDKDPAPFRKIPYRYNQMVIQSGYLPHWSTKVEGLEDGQARVIVGLNVFLDDVGPYVQQFPEHSEAFRQRVALLRQTNRQQRRELVPSPTRTLDLNSVRSNPKLARLLVLAKRDKAKRDFALARERLDRAIEEQLGADAGASVSVEMLMRRFGNGTTNGAVGKEDGHRQPWPDEKDVQVHIHRSWKEGRWQMYRNGNDDVPVASDNNNSECSLVRPEWIVRKTAELNSE